MGSLRVDQAWGSAQIAGALHQLRAGYYGNNTDRRRRRSWPGRVHRLLSPADAYGWAAMAGIVINLPWAKGDKFYVEGAVAEGAGAYVGSTAASVGKNNTFGRFNGGERGSRLGDRLDLRQRDRPRYAGGWRTWRSRSAADALLLDHGGARALLDAGIAHVSLGQLHCRGLQRECDGASSARHRLVRSRTFAGATPNFLTGAVLGCDPDFNVWAVGVRTIWNPAPQFDIGLEVMYSGIEQKHEAPNPAAARGVLFNFAGAGGRAAGLYAPSNENVWASILRLQRNFWP